MATTRAILAPSFTQYPRYINLQEGQRLTLVYKYAGETLTYKLTLDGKPIKSDTKPYHNITFTQTECTVKVETPTSGGVYTFTLINDAGTASVNTEVHIDYNSL